MDTYEAVAGGYLINYEVVAEVWIHSAAVARECWIHFEAVAKGYWIILSCFLTVSDIFCNRCQRIFLVDTLEAVTKGYSIQFEVVAIMVLHCRYIMNLLPEGIG